MRHGTLRSTLAKAALLLTSLVLALALCEGLMRLLGYAAIYETYSNPELLWQHDPVLGWTNEPNSRADYVGPRPWPVEFAGDVAINSMGLRGPELEPLPDGGVRILFVGDSMVAGFEVDYDETFCARLERLLSERIGRPVQVVNAGVRGYGTDQTYLYFRERGRLHRPHVVVQWLSDNDLLDDLTIHRMRRVFGKPAFVETGQGALELVGSPVPIYPECSEFRVGESRTIERVDTHSGRLLCRIQLALFDRSALFSFVTTLLTADRFGTLIRDLYHLGMPSPTLERSETGPPPSPPITHRILRSMSRSVAESGARFFVVSPPSVLQRFEQAGVALLESEKIALDRIESADPAVVQFKHDSHYTAAGHALVAEQLSDVLAPIVEAMGKPEASASQAETVGDLAGSSATVPARSDPEAPE